MRRGRRAREREYLFDGNTLLAEVARAKDGAIRWRKTYVPGADLHDHVQVRVETYDAAQNLVSDRLYAYIRDEQGTVLALADEASDPKNPSIPIRYLYTPYGNAHAETGPELRKGSYGFGITSGRCGAWRGCGRFRRLRRGRSRRARAQGRT